MSENPASQERAPAKEPPRELFWSHVGTVLWKDLQVELRSREIVYTTAFFAAMVVLLFSFAFDGESANEKGLTAGIIWVSVIFSGTLALSRAFERERESDTLRALLLAPVPRSAIFLGKAASVAVFMLIVEAVVVALVALLFGAPIAREPLLLAITLVLGTAGIALVGSFFAATLLRARARDILLPVLLYPLLVPLFMAVSFATTALLAPQANPRSAIFWIEFAGVYDAFFALAGLWIFELVVIE